CRLGECDFGNEAAHHFPTTLRTSQLFCVHMMITLGALVALHKAQSAHEHRPGLVPRSGLFTAAFYSSLAGWQVPARLFFTRPGGARPADPTNERINPAFGTMQGRDGEPGCKPAGQANRERRADYPSFPGPRSPVRPGGKEGTHGQGQSPPGRLAAGC